MYAAPIQRPTARPKSFTSWPSLSHRKPSLTTGAPLFLKRLDRPSESQNKNRGAEGTSAVQAKLTVGAPGDAYEREADQVAEQVSRMPDSHVAQPFDEEEMMAPAPSRVQTKPSSTPLYLQRKRDQCAEASSANNPHTLMQTKAEKASGKSASCCVSKTIQSPAGGKTLPRQVKNKVESVLNRDLSHVRVHDDADAHQAATSLNAKAFTHQNHIYLGQGQSASDAQLMSHEATHVAQQSYGLNPAKIMRKPPTSEPAWPSGGIRIIGSDKNDLLNIFASCTGAPMSLDGTGMLEIGPGTPKVPKGASAAALTALRHQVSNKSFGIIVDTDPAAEAVGVGAFSHAYPGYQSLDVANIKMMAAASGASGGLDACSATVHEITEAAAGRRLGREGKLKGKDIYRSAHTKGTTVEEKIRTELGLPLRDPSKGNIQRLGNEDAKKLLLLDAKFFGSGKGIRTHLSLVRFVLGKPKGQEISGDYNVIASHVVAGEEKFSSQREALVVFNKYASKFGFMKLPVPAK